MSGPAGIPRDWRNSSFSATGDDCVEFFQYGDGVVGLRNTRNGHGFAVLVDARGWMAFAAGVKAGEFDVPVEETS